MKALLHAHAIVLPIVLPLVAGALLVVLESSRQAWLRRLVRPLSLFALVALGLVALLLLGRAADGSVQAYLAGNWAAPVGIVLALDRLSALMLVLTVAVAAPALCWALGGEDRRGPHFHSLLQLQLMGLNGAFLTADLFNLFVFFEVLLAASYGLLLHGAGRARLGASLHYVVFNLVGSALFLLAASLLFGVTGTLNLADLADRLARLPAPELPLARAALALLMVVFAIKAALVPLYFWLPEAYAAASAPAAALFAIMTKVGVYALARTTTLLTGAEAGALSGLASPVLPVLALATVALAAIGALAARRLRILVAYLVVGSAGTLLLAVGLGSAAALSAGLFYLVGTTLVAAAWFLLADRVAGRGVEGDRLVAGPRPAGALAAGVAFMLLAVASAGLPPLPGFLGKALLLRAAGEGGGSLAAASVAVLLGSGLALLIALVRAGMTLFWSPATSPPPPAARPSASPAADRLERWTLGLLLAAVTALTPLAGRLARFTDATAAQLVAPRDYRQAVLGARPVPAAFDLRREMRERGEGP